MEGVIGEVRKVFVVVRPRDRTAYAATQDRATADEYSRQTGFSVEEWTERVEMMGDLRFWNLQDPTKLRDDGQGDVRQL